jgi:hypothetical protein
MKSKTIKFITALIFVAALVMSPGMTGQQPQSTGHHHYKVVDLARSAGPRATFRMDSTEFSTTREHS